MKPHICSTITSKSRETIPNQYLLCMGHQFKLLKVSHFLSVPISLKTRGSYHPPQLCRAPKNDIIIML